MLKFSTAPAVFSQSNEDGTKEVVIFDFEPFNVLVEYNGEMRMYTAEFHFRSTSYSFGETLPIDAKVRVIQ